MEPRHALNVLFNHGTKTYRATLRPYRTRTAKSVIVFTPVKDIDLVCHATTVIAHKYPMMIAVNEDAEARYSAYAGCSCGCSPGYTFPTTKPTVAAIWINRTRKMGGVK